MLGLHLHPERMLVPALAEYPAHLHIDLLPEWQGKGWGRGLMEAFLRGVHAAGAARVHLGVAPDQHRGAGLLSTGWASPRSRSATPASLYLGRDTAVAG